jgi:predicted nicotinamide N-methyase
VVEIRGNGVLDSIGGEVWEAAVLLSSYIILHPERFCLRTVLELGSGVGLPGLLLADLQMQVSCQFETEVCLTDNDPRCVESLSGIVASRFVESSNPSEERKFAESGSMKISVAELDWSDYRTTLKPVSSAETDGLEKCDEQPKLLDQERFQVVMGSALCYSPYHSVLADALLHFLKGACEEVVIIQIKDREGFDRFLKRLVELDIRHTVEAVSEEVYVTAQHISARSLGGHERREGVEQLSAVSCSREGGDEESVGCVREFTFPSGLVRDAVSRAEVFAATGERIPHKEDMHLPIEEGRGLIRTDREAFVVVRATKGSYKAMNATAGTAFTDS